VFEDVGFAEERGIPITEFWAMSDVDQAYFLARRRASSTIAAYEAMIAKKESERKT
jgi:hypothetical protein